MTNAPGGSPGGPPSIVIPSGLLKMEGRAPARPRNDALVNPRCIASLKTVSLPERKRPSHIRPIERRKTTLIFFVTICTKDRKKVLNNSITHKALVRAWRSADQWLVGRYMIMPDHIHLFCSPTTVQSCSMAAWIQFWKSQTTKTLPSFGSGSLWQASFWDRQLRSTDSYSQKWDYVSANPVRAGLADRTGEWPYQGELNVFRFRSG